MNSRRRIDHASSRVIGSLSRPRTHGNGLRPGLLLILEGCLRCMSLHLAEADIPAQSNGAGFDVVDGARCRHPSAIGWSS